MVRRLNPLTICRPIVENKRYYAPTTLESIIECPRRRYLQKTFNKKLTWPDFAKGTHLHRKIAELRTHHLRHLKGKKKRYGSAEAFANVVANDWQRVPINQGMIDKNKILWDETLPNQPYILKSEIHEIALRIYPLLMAELETVIIFANKTQKDALSIRTAYNFEFVYKGRGFTGEIDEIRKANNKIIIRDYKSGKWSFIEKKQEYAHQPTEYTFAICYESLVNEQFRKAIGISFEQAQSWIAKPELMSENIEFEYFMLDICKEWDKEKKEYLKIDKNHIIKVQRNEFNYKELCLGIDMAEALLTDMKDQGYYTPKHPLF